ncbi:adenylyl-sulfate kinase [Gryllotalpicola protaetiae]|uniref:Adenylyl-sulfate kinase n=1 Tax=Gryllotalpicola protaetiae TaxID=2419771 RepID=A0A387C2W3_9MICO|nr:adenylyl-sulfate kinase [Gryllotalpicola protaetiae]AYG04881.1 adenylyl-sulfate kinase [Gryllotalpicola protaetiae]
MRPLEFDAVWINGSVGTGKTTTAEAVGAELERLGVPGAVIDVDWLRRAWPAPAGDRFNEALARANIRAIAANFREHGARVIVSAGVIEAAAELGLVSDALAARRMLHVLLTLDPVVAAARLQARHGEDAGLEWHLRRHPELAGILDRAGFKDEVVVDTTRLSPDAAARAIVARVFPPTGTRITE